MVWVGELGRNAYVHTHICIIYIYIYIYYMERITAYIIVPQLSHMDKKKAEKILRAITSPPPWILGLFRRDIKSLLANIT
jgi:hypothetical protein